MPQPVNPSPNQPFCRCLDEGDYEDDSEINNSDGCNSDKSKNKK